MIVTAYISRKEINLSFVTTFWQKKIYKSYLIKWDDKLSESVKEIKKKSNFSSIRISVDESLSYSSTLEIRDINNLGADIRTEIANWIYVNIPENLSIADWDYKIISEDKETMKVVVFAPVQGYFKTLVNALVDNNIQIEAVEPADESLKRNSNACIGIALKKDIKGKDENVLNVIAKKYIAKK